MLPGSRMMAALQHREPDRVPIGELAVNPLRTAFRAGRAARPR
jgi:hypothetical protein